MAIFRQMLQMSIILMILSEKKIATFAMPCSASLDTVVAVDRCPRNRIEWDARATFFNCSARNQTCVEPDQFKYHCAMNDNYTALIELCAPPIPIHGRSCTEFNSRGKLIQESLINCSKVDPVQCPMSYMSTEAYKYQSCYDDIQQKTHKDNKQKENCSCTFKSSLESTMFCVPEFVGISLIATAYLGYGLLLWRVFLYLRRLNLKGKTLKREDSEKCVESKRKKKFYIGKKNKRKRLHRINH